VIFCAGNELERTDFKSGFAGVKETTNHRNRLFGFSLANKVGLASWYALQYLINPRYFNESFVDTMGAFFQTFVAKDDFLYLFDYLKWDEGEINKTLIGQYGWEGAVDSDNTWRVGDGYTSFINYIYHTVAGFSEYDTFRSNQIREGLITREQAQELLAKDNEPKLDVLYDFAKHTGFNLEEVLTRINSIDKLY
jgi:glucosamine--fructose-6-phosphate aminotransferase (isomerizing)